MDESFIKSKDAGNPESEELQKKNYEAIARKLAVIVKEISDLPIPENTIEDWRILASAVYFVDHRIDNITDEKERSFFMERIAIFLKGDAEDFSEDKDLEKTMQDIRNLSEGLSNSQREFFINCLLNTLKVTEEIKVEENPKNLANLTRLEGQIFAKIFLPFLPEDFKQSKDYHKLVHALTRLGRVANSFDSFVDLPTDYKNKQIKVKPSLQNRIILLGSILSDSVALLKDTGISKDLIKILFKATKRVAKDALK